MKRNSLMVFFSLVLLAGCAQVSGFFGPDSTRTLANTVYGELIIYKTMATEDLKAGRISIDDAKYVRTMAKELEAKLEQGIAENDIGMVQSVQTATILAIMDYMEMKK